MTITIDSDNIEYEPTLIDSTDSPYTTQGEQYIYVDTSNGAVTVTLASSDTNDGQEIRIIDTGGNAATNNITVNTEGTETINPGAKSSVTLSVDGTYLDLFSDGANWFDDKNSDKDSVSSNSVSTDEATINQSILMGSEPFTLYVRSSGSDSNTGLATDDALASIEEAFSRVPRIAVGTSTNPGVEINVEAGITYTEPRLLLMAPQQGVEITTDTDGTTATIESTAATGEAAIRDRSTLLVFDDVEVTPADPANRYESAVLTEFGWVQTTGNTHITAGTQDGISLNPGSVADVISGTIEGDNQSLVVGVSSNQFTYASVSSGATVQNCNIGVLADDQAGAAVVGTIDNCSEGIRAQDNGRAKAEDGTVQNCTTAFNPTEGGTIKRNNTTLTGNGSELPDTFRGSYHDLDNDRWIEDGIEELESGTVSVGAGGVANTPNTYPTGDELSVNYGFASDPSDTAEVSFYTLYSGGGQRIRFEEEIGNAGVDVEYTIYRSFRPT